MHLKTDDGVLDTTLVYNHDCVVHEEVLPSVSFGNGNDNGYYTWGGAVLINFEYRCVDGFEGMRQ